MFFNHKENDMETATNTNGKRKAKGRKDEEKQEAVIKTEALAVKADELVRLYKAQEEAATDFADAVKAAAESSGLHAKNVRSFIIAKAGDKFEEKKQQVEQLALIFEEVKA